MSTESCPHAARLITPSSKPPFPFPTSRFAATSNPDERVSKVDTMPTAMNSNMGPLSEQVAISQWFVCPLSLEIMIDPVIVSSGETFERAHIKRWFSEGNQTCPKTHAPLASQLMVPNVALKGVIEEWRMAHRIDSLAGAQPWKPAGGAGGAEALLLQGRSAEANEEAKEHERGHWDGAQGRREMRWEAGEVKLKRDGQQTGNLLTPSSLAVESAEAGAGAAAAPRAVGRAGSMKKTADFLKNKILQLEIPGGAMPQEGGSGSAASTPRNFVDSVFSPMKLRQKLLDGKAAGSSLSHRFKNKLGLSREQKGGGEGAEVERGELHKQQNDDKDGVASSVEGLVTEHVSPPTTGEETSGECTTADDWDDDVDELSPLGLSSTGSHGHVKTNPAAMPPMPSSCRSSIDRSFSPRSSLSSDPPPPSQLRSTTLPIMAAASGSGASVAAAAAAAAAASHGFRNAAFPRSLSTPSTPNASSTLPSPHAVGSAPFAASSTADRREGGMPPHSSSSRLRDMGGMGAMGGSSPLTGEGYGATRAGQEMPQLGDMAISKAKGKMLLLANEMHPSPLSPRLSRFHNNRPSSSGGLRRTGSETHTERLLTADMAQSWGDMKSGSAAAGSFAAVMAMDQMAAAQGWSPLHPMRCSADSPGRGSSGMQVAGMGHVGVGSAWPWPNGCSPVLSGAVGGASDSRVFARSDSLPLEGGYGGNMPRLGMRGGSGGRVLRHRQRPPGVMGMAFQQQQVVSDTPTMDMEPIVGLLRQAAESSAAGSNSSSSSSSSSGGPGSSEESRKTAAAAEGGKEEGSSREGEMEAVQVLQSVRKLLRHNMVNKERFVAAGGLQPLLDSLMGDDPVLLEHAVTALFNLTNIPGCSEDILAKGRLDGITNALLKSTKTGKENAAAALFMLTSSRQLTDGQARGIVLAVPALVELLAGKDTLPRGKRDAMLALFTLACNDWCRQHLIMAGAVEVLLTLLGDAVESSSPEDPNVATMEELAVAILANVSLCFEGCEAIAMHGGIAALAEILETGETDRLKEDAVQTLLRVASADDAHLALVVAEGINIPLARVAKSGTVQGIAVARELLDILKNAAAANSGLAIPPLVPTSTSLSPPSSCKSSGSMAKLPPLSRQDSSASLSNH